MSDERVIKQACNCAQNCTIIYAWLNDESTLRKAGSQTDPYAVFHRMLERGAPPSDWDALVRACEAMSSEE